ncbi:MAG: DUF5104 domain-containing protein [Candidatus Gastranaerophilales bacterium]|nr:DUF5104 domain-containing protein [Candidatus Gastranaerophilales bacterium]
MKKKRFTVFLYVIMVLCITGCDAPKTRRVNPVYADAQTTVAFLIDAIERKDAQSIKDMFSPYAKSKIEHFDEKIDRFIEEFPGWNEDYELSDTFQRWSNHGKITNMLTPSYDFTVDGRTYCMRIIYYKESDEDESKLGWYSLQIWERNAGYSSGVYIHGVDDEPDVLLWDYLKTGAEYD